MSDKYKNRKSVKDGSHHWFIHKLTAIAMLPLAIWFIFVVISLHGQDSAHAIEFFKKPTHAVVSVLFLLSGFYHASLGLQAIIEDYVHCTFKKFFLIIFIKLSFFVMSVLGIFSVLKIAL